MNTSIVGWAVEDGVEVAVGGESWGGAGSGLGLATTGSGALYLDCCDLNSSCKHPTKHELDWCLERLKPNVNVNISKTQEITVKNKLWR